MSQLEPLDQRRSAEYVARVLQLNPMQHGEEIIRARSELIGATARSSEVANEKSQPEVDRREILGRLETVRAGFWTLPLETLDQQLAELASHDLPELRAAIERLRTLALHRSEFHGLMGRPGYDGNFLASLKKVLVQSPRDTVILREQILQTLHDRVDRSRVRRTLTQLKGDLPQIYQLEVGWFDSLAQQKGRPKALLPSLDRPDDGRRGHKWWAIVAIVTAVRVGSMAFREASHNDRPTRYAPNQYQSQFDQSIAREMLLKPRPQFLPASPPEGRNSSDKSPFGFGSVQPYQFGSQSSQAATPIPTPPQPGGVAVPAFPGSSEVWKEYDAR